MTGFENATERRYTVAMHEIAWTPEKIERFWNYYSSNRALDGTYFTKIVGRSIVRYAERRIAIGATLDIGCGHGDLIRFLLEHTHVAGADQSSRSVEIVNERFAGGSNFLGAKVGTAAFPSGSFDSAFLVEVVEHMDDDALGAALADARRLLKPGGHLVITTPNDEDLDASKRMCPDCGCVFHQMQHVRSWSPASLSEYLAKFGFKPVDCRPTLLSSRKGFMAIADRLRYARRKLPHLVYIGTAD